MSWMQRFQRVFDIDLRHYPRCGASLRVLAVITDPGVIGPILAHRGMHAASAPPLLC